MDGLWRIRAATVADLPALVAAEQRCFADPWSETGIAELLVQPGTLPLVALANGPKLDLAGYLLVRAIADEAEILNLAVLPECRRRGLGRLLLAEGLKQLKSAGTLAVYLEVRESNDAAKALYAGAGFRPVGVRSDYYRAPRENALVLRRDLGRVVE